MQVVLTVNNKARYLLLSHKTLFFNQKNCNLLEITDLTSVKQEAKLLNQVAQNDLQTEEILSVMGPAIKVILTLALVLV